MKRTTNDAESSSVWQQSSIQQKQKPVPQPARDYRNLSLANASQTAMELLNSSPPDTTEFGHLLDAMFDQGIRPLKLAGPLSDGGYAALIQEFESNPFRLQHQIRGLDLSGAELPQISTLLKLVEKFGNLESLDLARTGFPAARGGTSEGKQRLPLQPAHLRLVARIVKTNPNLTYLDLSDQGWLSDTLIVRHGLVQFAPMHELMQACRSSKLEVLKLRNSQLGSRDMDHIRAWLRSEAQATPTPSLLELDLKGNPLPDYPWEEFFRSIKGHKSLEKLYLPAQTDSWWSALDEKGKAEVVKNLEACPQLEDLAPPSLAYAEGIRQLLKEHDPLVLQMQLMTAALAFRSYEGMYTDAMGLSVQAVAQRLNKNVKRVLPPRLHFPPRPDDFKVVLPSAPEPEQDPL